MRHIRLGIRAPALCLFALAWCLWTATAAVTTTAPATVPGHDGVPHAREALALAIDALKARYRRPTGIPFPEDNPFSPAKAALGRKLFFDPSLSADGMLACASCHKPGHGWRDGLPRAIGRDGIMLARRTPAIVDLAWCEDVLWDGRLDLDAQAVDPIRLPKIGNRMLPALAASLQRDATYQASFAAAFGEGAITPAHIGAAIATFERTVVSPRSAFDAWINGDEGAIGKDAKRGFALFNGAANCKACHDTWRFTDDGFHDIGLPDDRDLGRGKILPREPTLQHAFKTPTLRSAGGGVALDGPFMHDGSLTTLDGVLTEYSSGFVRRPSLDPAIRGFALSARDRHDLKAFLVSINARPRR